MIQRCPYCGRPANVIGVDGFLRIACNKMGCLIGPTRKTEDNAIRAWNRIILAPVQRRTSKPGNGVHRP